MDIQWRIININTEIPGQKYIGVEYYVGSREFCVFKDVLINKGEDIKQRIIESAPLEDLVFASKCQAKREGTFKTDNDDDGTEQLPLLLG